MGTRNLTMVIQKEETKVAQYGQWDGYPSGQGATIVAFLLANLGNNLEKFRAAVAECSWLTEEENDENLKAAYVMSELRKAKDPANPTAAEKAAAEKYATERAEQGWMTMEESECYKITSPGTSRDFGAKVLEFIQDGNVRKLNDSTDFAQDSLFCEWAYVVDLDNNVLEVYSGFQKGAPQEGNRFGVEKTSDHEYYPVHLLTKFTFDELQELGVDGFIAKCNELTAEDEDEE